MRIALAQTDATLGDIDANVAHAADTIDEAVEADADLVVFPELHISGYSVLEVDKDLAMSSEDPRLLSLAAQFDGGLVLGFVEGSRSGLHDYNATAYYEAGELVHVHRKLYLPTYGRFEERKYFTPGPTMQAFPTFTGGRMAVLNCNDAWQPPLAFLATQDGARVFLIPAASDQSTFPEHYDSRGYWRGITRFYGRMLEVFVVFVNRVGTEGDLHFWGGSHVVDPWGEVIVEVEHDRPELVMVDIDPDDVRRRRHKVPLVKEARLGLIRREVDRLLEEGGDF